MKQGVDIGLRDGVIYLRGYSPDGCSVVVLSPTQAAELASGLMVVARRLDGNLRMPEEPSPEAARRAALLNQAEAQAGKAGLS